MRFASENTRKGVQNQVFFILQIRISNVFIQAHRMHYPFDVVPSFWNKLLDLSDNQTITSIDKVKKELCDNANQDILSDWCVNELHLNFFVNTENCIDKYAEIANWTANHLQFTQQAKDVFLATDLADPWLIAYAMQNNCIIVTQEISQPQIKNRIKIPEPCNHFGIRFINTITMFRELGEQF